VWTPFGPLGYIYTLVVAAAMNGKPRLTPFIEGHPPLK
jgi:hypothetical protein